MSEVVREMTREELIAENNRLRELNEQLEANIKSMMDTAKSHTRELQEEQSLHKLYKLEGTIEGLKFALRCNGISGWGDRDER